MVNARWCSLHHNVLKSNVSMDVLLRGNGEQQAQLLGIVLRQPRTEIATVASLVLPTGGQGIGMRLCCL